MLSSEVRELEQENKRLKETIEALNGKEREADTCGNCRFFIQHYVLADRKYIPTNCGHCKHGSRTKGRKPKDTCEYFEYDDTPWYLKKAVQ